MNRPTQPQGSRPMDVSDARTLALATPPLTEALLTQWMSGQRAQLDTLESEGLADRAQRLAAGHARALVTAELDAQVFAQVESVVRTFCGVMTTIAAVEKKLAALGEGTDAEQHARITAELERLRALTPLRQRHGDDAVALLLVHAPGLMDLHVRLRAALD